jgi:hypothetical protein
MQCGSGSVVPLPELHQRLIRPLNVAGIRYMVTGGLAAIVYGEPRLTNDVDLVVQLSPTDPRRLNQVYDASEYYVPSIETIEAEAARRMFGHFNIVHIESALRADVYCVGDDDFGAWGFRHRRSVDIANESIWLAPIEYVIVQKLRYFRESGQDRHLRDIAAMRRISGELIDENTINEWVVRLVLQAEWEKVLQL